jgi:hypothetical protein
MHAIPAVRLRALRSIVALAVLASAALLAPTVASASSATVTRATLPSFYVDEEGTFFPATCNVTQVINVKGRMETFRCTFDAVAPAPFVCDTCSWSSDFDGAPAISNHFLVTPSGLMLGWAKY